MKYLFILPGLLLVLFVVVYPTAFLYYTSLTDFRMGRPATHFIGLDNFIKVLGDPFFWNSLRATVVFALTTVPIECILGLLIAMACANIRSERLSTILRPILVFPVMLTPVVVGMIWVILFNPDYGIVNIALNMFGLTSIPFVSDPFWAPIVVALVDVWQWTPFFMLILTSGLYAIPSEYLETAKVDRLTSWMTFRYVILPFLLPLITFTLLVRLIDAFKIYDVIYIMTYGGPGISTEVLSFRIWKNMFLERSVGYAAAFSIYLLLIVVILANLLQKVIKKVMR